MWKSQTRPKEIPQALAKHECSPSLQALEVGLRQWHGPQNLLLLVGHVAVGWLPVKAIVGLGKWLLYM